MNNIANHNQNSSLSVEYLKKRIATLHPAYFALVMATGIISLDCNIMGLKELSQILFGINIIAYAVLWVIYGIRLHLFSSNFVSDLFSHKRAFGFFTIVAATNVLGSQFFILAKNQVAAEILWWTGLILWVLCTYSIFVFLIVQKQKPSIEEGINGGWLVAVVATQSVSVLGCMVKPQIVGSSEFSAIFMLSFWLFGGILYIWLISLIFYRYMFFKFDPSDLIPPYWINMGAMAITTLAGAELINIAVDYPIITNMLPFMKGLTMMFWATATWWIPMLLILGVWRHYIKRFRFTYDPLYWGLVFPLGMYSVCTFKLGAILQIEIFSQIARLFLIFGLSAWLLTFLSMTQRPLYAILLCLKSWSKAKNSVNVQKISNMEEQQYEYQRIQT